MEQRPENPKGGSVSDRSKWLALSPPGWEWLIVEHADGRLEDLGFVETQRYVSLPESQAEEAPGLKLRWRTADDLRQGATLIAPEHRDAEGNPVSPYPVALPDGTHQLWHLGRAAHRKATDCGLLWTFVSPHLA
ncbi:MAG: hypothetical protein ACO1SV_18705 [Fimbriimonas sp.]